MTIKKNKKIRSDTLADYRWVINFIMPLGLILYGYLYKNKASKKVSNFFGYKTARTQISQKTWEYANKRVGEIWIKLGIGFTAFVAILLLLVPSQREKPSFIVIALAIILSITPFPIVEKELKVKFDNKGEPK